MVDATGQVLARASGDGLVHRDESAELTSAQIGLLVMKNRRKRLEEISEVNRRYGRRKSLAVTELHDHVSLLVVESDRIRADRVRKMEAASRMKKVARRGLIAGFLGVVSLGLVIENGEQIKESTVSMVLAALDIEFPSMGSVASGIAGVVSFEPFVDEKEAATHLADQKDIALVQEPGKSEGELWVKRSARPYVEGAEAPSGGGEQEAEQAGNAFVVLPDGVTRVESSMSRSESTPVQAESEVARKNLAMAGFVAQSQVLVGENRYEKIGKMSMRLGDAGGNAPPASKASVAPAKKAPVPQDRPRGQQPKPAAVRDNARNEPVNESAMLQAPALPTPKVQAPTNLAPTGQQNVQPKAESGKGAVSSSSGVSPGQRIRATGETVLAITDKGDVITDMRVIKASDVPAIMKGANQ